MLQENEKHLLSPPHKHQYFALVMRQHCPGSMKDFQHLQNYFLYNALQTCASSPLLPLLHKYDLHLRELCECPRYYFLKQGRHNFL